MSEGDWYRVENEAEIPSPTLLVYPQRIIQNIQKAVDMVGDVKNLMPHVKTHKLPEIVGMHLSLGVKRFKCATIAKAEMGAGAGGRIFCWHISPLVQIVFVSDSSWTAIRLSVGPR